MRKKKENPAEPRKRSGAIREESIDTSDIPDLANTTGWIRGLMHRDVHQMSTCAPALDAATAQKLPRKRCIPD
jgi:hypothetical protein